MAENHSQNIDPRPKRRKAQDNPYTLFTVGIDTDHPHYYLSFRDGQGVQICMEVSKELYQAIDGFELEDLSYLNEMDNHYEHAALTETALHKRAFSAPVDMQDEICNRLQMEQLRRAVMELPEVQRRRVIAYYFEGLTFEQIAQKEHRSKQSIQESVAAALKKLKNFSW